MPAIAYDPAWTELVFEAAVALARREAKDKGIAPFRHADSGCSYHEHGSKGTCYRVMFE